jgi:hypothetical protein
MSSALAMVLMAAMAVPGNGPEKVSGEVEQGLDLSGDWQLTIEVEHGLGNVALVAAGSKLIKKFDIRDEGEGKVRLRFANGSANELLGIYRQEGDHILINCARAPDGRPTSFEKRESYIRIILHRVKPGK